MFLESLIAICSLCILIFIRHYWIRKQHPPGPLGFPLLGQLPFLIIQTFLPNILPKTSEQKYFYEMAQKYGDVWSFELGGDKYIVLTTIEAVNETLVDNGKVFSGRPKSELFKAFTNDCGIIFTDGTKWSANRQLAMKALKDFGMGRRNLENDICDESLELLEYIEKHCSSPINSPGIFVKATSNIITKLVFNDRNSYDDSKLENYLQNIKNVFSAHTAEIIMNFFPNLYKTRIMRKLFPSVDVFIKSNEKCSLFVEEKCRSRIKLESELANPICVFDYFWRYRYQDEPEITFEDKFLDISRTMYDLYNGGIDTSTNLLSFACLMLGKHKKVQDNLKEEIHSLVDDYKLINFEMKKNCPKILAFIDETQRFFYIIPSFYRRSLESVNFRGYEIKPTDYILANFSTIARDKRYFKNPNDFDPCRFLDETQTKYIPNKNLIPFGTGKRVCPGENLANMELFLFLSKIIYKFNIWLPKETEKRFEDILEGKYGIVHAPLDHKIIFKPRS